jgi:hypothetical protein
LAGVGVAFTPALVYTGWQGASLLRFLTFDVRAHLKVRLRHEARRTFTCLLNPTAEDGLVRAACNARLSAIGW